MSDGKNHLIAGVVFFGLYFLAALMVISTSTEFGIMVYGVVTLPAVPLLHFFGGRSRPLMAIGLGLVVGCLSLVVIATGAKAGIALAILSVAWIEMGSYWLYLERDVYRKWLGKFVR